jgi:hypothetical protein
VTGAAHAMQIAVVEEKLPRLVRAIRCLAAREGGDEAVMLADELAGITAMVAEKFTNERTAEGIQRAFFLAVGGVSLGLDHALEHEGDEAALDFLIEHGAEHAFQAGYRLVRELSQLPEDALWANTTSIRPSSGAEGCSSTCAVQSGQNCPAASVTTCNSSSARRCRRSCTRPAGCGAITLAGRSTTPTSMPKA